MATKLERLPGMPEPSVNEPLIGIDLLSPEAARQLFDRRAQQLLQISGDEFLHRWDTGAYDHIPDSVEGRKIGQLVMMMPLARRTNS